MEIFFKEYPELVYGIATCLCTFTILKYFIAKPTRIQKFCVLLISGIVLGTITYITTKVEIPLMMLAFFSSTGFYELIIKVIMRKLKISYQNSDKE